MERKLIEDQSSESNGGSDTDASQDGNFAHPKTFVCTLCSKKYKNVKTWKQHMQSHMVRRKCEFCDKSFVRTSLLNDHMRKVHGIQKQRKRNLSTFVCGDVCNKKFGRKYNLQRHTASVHQRVSPNRAFFACRHCDYEFQTYADLFNHVERNHPLNQQGGDRAVAFTKSLAESNDQNDQHAARNTKQMTEQKTEQETQNSEQPSQEDAHRQDDETALRNGVLNSNVYPRNDERYDVLTFFANVRERVRTLLESRARQLGGIKWNLCVQVEMQRDDGAESTLSTAYFRSRTYITLSSEDSNEHNLNEAMQKMFASLEEYMREGSGWFVKKVLKLEIHTIVYKPVSGSSYMPLPKTLLYSGSLLNIYNKDDKCFLYCVLAALHPTNDEPEHVEHYYQYEHELNMSGISYPVTLAQIHRVENQNKNISVNVFTYEDSSIMPLRITEHTHRQHHVNLLWLKRRKRALLSDNGS